MAKMYYTLEEVMDKLHISEDEVKSMVRAGKLREFRDAGKVHYMAGEVDALSGTGGGDAAASSGELLLEPAEGSTDVAGTAGLSSDILTLEDADSDDTSAGTKAEKKKDDTVVTSVGVSVFDDDELEDVDPLAQTVVTDEAADLGAEGVGSGSGLLDLTRESDDTSLGADLLDEIYSEGGGVEMGDATRAGLEEAITDDSDEKAEEPEAFEPEPAEGAPVAAAAPRTRVVVDYAPDAWSTAMTGMLVVGTVIMCLAGLTAAAMIRGVWPSVLEILSQNMPIFGGASAGLAVIGLLIGFFVGKRSEG